MSFLSSTSSPSAFYREDFSNTGKRDENGFHVQFPGFMITDIKLPQAPGDHFHFVDSDDQRKIWCLVPERSSINPLSSRDAWLSERKRRAEFDQMVCECEIAALIMNPRGFQGIEYLLVKVKGDIRDPSELLVRFMCRAGLFPVEVRGRTKEELEKNHGIQIKAKRLPDSQKWCVA